MAFVSCACMEATVAAVARKSRRLMMLSYCDSIRATAKFSIAISGSGCFGSVVSVSGRIPGRALNASDDIREMIVRLPDLRSATLSQAFEEFQDRLLVPG